LKIWKKSKLNRKDMENAKKSMLICEMKWKIWKKSKLNSKKIGKIQKEIVKRYEKYRRKL
jgi:hypothetical protein